MKVRFKKRPDSEYHCSRFNPVGFGEVIIQGENIGADSVFVVDLEIFVESKQTWKDMAIAFKEQDILPDNYNLWFSEPKTEQDRLRGYIIS